MSSTSTSVTPVSPLKVDFTAEDKCQLEASDFDWLPLRNGFARPNTGMVIKIESGCFVLFILQDVYRRGEAIGLGGTRVRISSFDSLQLLLDVVDQFSQYSFTFYR